MLSCNKEELEGNVDNTTNDANILKEFRAVFPDMTVKSISNPDSGKSSWEKGDKILVDNGSDIAVFEYNTSRGVFVTERDDFAIAESYNAVYPASSYIEESEIGSPMINISASPHLTQNYIRNLEMVATAGKDAEFVFHNPFAVVKIEFPSDKLPSTNSGEVVKLEFNAAGSAVAGTAVVANGTLTLENSSTKSLTFDCTQEKINVNSPIYVPILAQKYVGGFYFTFTFADDSTVALTCENDADLQPNEVSLQRLMNPWTSFSGGDGSETAPYIINSIADYREFIEKCTTDASYLSKAYKQTSDLDLSSEWYFKPVGSADAPFTGTYDGGNHCIKGVEYLTDASGHPVAMFRYSDGATIKNLKLLDWGMSTRAQYLGGFAGVAMNTTFENCEWNGKLQQLAKATMEGFETDNVSDNSNFGFAGGIAAFAENCTFTDCVFNGQMSSSGKCIGGITGYARKSRMTKCSATAASEIHTPVDCAGQIAGVMTQNSTASDCSVAGRVAAVQYGGGVVGYLQSGNVEKCVASSSAIITGKGGYIGGIAGIMASKGGETASIDRCTVYSDVMGAYAVGGIVGFINGNDSSGNVHITNSTYKSGTLSATGVYNSKYSLLGGIVGWMDHTAVTIIENCMTAPGCLKTAYAQGATADTMGGTGGIFGYNHSTKTTYVSNCYTATGMGNLMHRGGAPTSFSGYTLWGLAAGRNNAAVTSTEAKNYFNSDSGRGIAPGEKGDANLEGLTNAQMTDGTLLGKLNTGIASLQLNSSINMANWIEGEDRLPKLDCEITDPQPRDNSAKRVSIIGDSISTFGGYIPTGYGHHYPCADGSVTRVEQTYWWQLIYDKMENARLDINMSYSGTSVAAKNPSNDIISYVSRYIRLGGIGNPDVVIIHGGTNDRAANHIIHPNTTVNCKSNEAPNANELEKLFATADAAKTREEIEALAYQDFCSAYVKLIRLIQEQYPKAKIVCIIGDHTSESIQKSIIAIANHYDNTRYVDLYGVNGFNDQVYMPKHDYTGSNLDGASHPGIKAMEFISDKIYNELGSWLEE